MKKRRARKHCSKRATRHKYSRLASVCDKTRVSDKAAAIVASSILHDKTGCLETNPKLVIDHKLEGVVKKRENIIKRLMQQLKKFFVGPYFDGRKDETLKQIVVGRNAESKLYKKSMYQLL